MADVGPELAQVGGQAVAKDVQVKGKG